MRGTLPCAKYQHHETEYTQEEQRTHIYHGQRLGELGLPLGVQPLLDGLLALGGGGLLGADLADSDGALLDELHRLFASLDLAPFAHVRLGRLDGDDVGTREDLLGAEQAELLPRVDDLLALEMTFEGVAVRGELRVLGAADKLDTYSG